MKMILNPLSFLKIGDKVEGCFPMLLSPAQVEKDGDRNTEGIVVWPPESSRIVDTGGDGVKAARGLWN